MRSLTFIILLLSGVVIAATAQPADLNEAYSSSQAERSFLQIITQATTAPPGVPTTPSLINEPQKIYENLSLSDCIVLAIKNDYSLKNSRRDLMLAHSRYREERAFFIPHSELNAKTEVGEIRTHVTEVTTESGTPGGAPRTRTEQVVVEQDYSGSEAGVKLTQNLPTGGDISVSPKSRRDHIEDEQYRSTLEVGFTQPLLQGAGLNIGLAGLKLAKLDELSAQLSDFLNHRDVALSVIRQYFTILKAKLELKVSEDALREKGRFLRDTQLRYELEQIPESEVFKAQIQYLQEQESLGRKRQSYHDAIERLLLIMGLPLDSKLTVLDITSLLMQRAIISYPGLEQCIEEALGGRPELIQSQLVIRRSAIGLSQARNSLLPGLDFNTSFFAYETDEAFRPTANTENNEWNVNLGLSVPFPNLERRESALRTQISLDKAKTNYVIQERNIIREVKEAYRSLETTRANLEILKRTVEQAVRNLELEHARFEFGLATSTDVRNAQDDLFEAQSRYNSALLEYHISLAQLYKAMGRNIY